MTAQTELPIELREHVVYRFRDLNGVLLYVGMTHDLPSRMRAHAKDKAWWPDVAKVESESYPDKAAAATAELLAIVLEKPLHNVTGSDFDADTIALALRARLRQIRWEKFTAAVAMMTSEIALSRALVGISWLAWAIWAAGMGTEAATWTDAAPGWTLVILVFGTGVAWLKRPGLQLHMLIPASIPAVIGQWHRIGLVTTEHGRLVSELAIHICVVVLTGVVLGAVARDMNRSAR